MTDTIVTSAYQELHGLVQSVEHGRPRTLALVENTLEVVRAFVPSEIAHMVSFLLTAPTVKIRYEDEEFEDHDDTNPFCADTGCPCHEDADNIAELSQYYQDGLASRDDADNIYRGRTV